MQRINSLTGAQDEIETNRMIHLKKFLKGHQVKLFWIALSPPSHGLCFVTNDHSQVQPILLRMKVLSDSFIVNASKQPVWNHLNAILNAHSAIILPLRCRVWARLNQIAQQTQTTVYQIKEWLLDNYLCSQLRHTYPCASCVSPINIAINSHFSP